MQRVQGELHKHQLAMATDQPVNREQAPVSAMGADREAHPSERRLLQARKARLAVRVFASHTPERKSEHTPTGKGWVPALTAGCRRRN